MRIYLDHNATTPLDSSVLEAMMPYFQDRFGNPSSIHRFGQDARRALDLSREKVADLVGAHPEEIVFTSGGTEAANYALKGAWGRAQADTAGIVTSAIEHPAVLETCEFLAEQGANVTELPCDQNGLVRVDELSAALKPGAALVSVMLANNDVGAIQPLQQIAEMSGAHKVLCHTDAVQAVGKIPVDVRSLGVDLLSFSSHKIYGPKGAGALFVKRGTDLTPLLHGGHQEFRRRGGTENLAAIVGFARACELSRDRLEQDATHIEALTDQLMDGIRDRIPHVKLNGLNAPRIPGSLNVQFPGIDGETLLMALDLEGVGISLGSACTAGSSDPSHVLLAMGLSEQDARSSVRFSIGRGNTSAEIATAITIIERSVARLSAAGGPV